jgi:hypothetical protein
VSCRQIEILQVKRKDKEKKDRKIGCRCTGVPQGVEIRKKKKCSSPVS